MLAIREICIAFSFNVIRASTALRLLSSRSTGPMWDVPIAYYYYCSAAATSTATAITTTTNTTTTYTTITTSDTTTYYYY
jgi:hypothetical protein